MNPRLITYFGAKSILLDSENGKRADSFKSFTLIMVRIGNMIQQLFCENEVSYRISIRSNSGNRKSAGVRVEGGARSRYQHLEPHLVDRTLAIVDNHELVPIHRGRI